MEASFGQVFCYKQLKNWRRESLLWSEGGQVCEDSKRGESIEFFKQRTVRWLSIHFPLGTRQPSPPASCSVLWILWGEGCQILTPFGETEKSFEADLSLENGVISPRLLKAQSVGDSLLVQWLLWAGFPQTCPPSPPHSGVGRREGPVGGQAFGGPLENPLPTPDPQWCSVPHTVDSNFTRMRKPSVGRNTFFLLLSDKPPLDLVLACLKLSSLL